MKSSRRDLLRYGACGLLGRAAFISGFERFSLVSAMAAPAGNYKALVCIFMFGGNDSNNTLISLDNYTQYSTTRGVLAIPQTQLLPISPKSGGNYALHPSMGGLQSLFQSKALAILCNVGTLTAPIMKSQYQAGKHPNALFSHSDQQNQWQTSSSSSNSPSGWGGRMSDATAVAPSGFPTICSVAGVSIFSVGASTQPIAIAPAPTPLNQTLRIVQQDGAISSILAVDRETTSPLLVRASDNLTQFAINNSARLNTNPTIHTSFHNTGLGNQLLQVAKTMSISSALGLTRQIFFCSIGGFDTHTVQLPTQMSLLQQLSDAMKAFYDATVELGLSSKVTTFTLSDFSRTFKPAGTVATTAGSDHAWGSHQFIMGDSVIGGDLYGAFPDLIPGGNQDVDSGTGARGRWIPTSSVDEYASTLALWYGLPASDLSVVFPNIGSFPKTDLGFMAP